MLAKSFFYVYNNTLRKAHGELLYSYNSSFFSQVPISCLWRRKFVQRRHKFL